MRNMHILIMLCLFSTIVCFAHADHEGVLFSEPYFDEHDKQVAESLRRKMKEDQGVNYDSLNEKQRNEKLQRYIEGYIKEIRSEQQLVKIKNKPMNFYGKVVDKNGLAIEGASVTMLVEEEKMIGKKFLAKKIFYHRHVVVTNELGTFMIKDTVGWRVRLENIEARGYLFDPANQPTLYFFPVRHPAQLKAPYFFRQDERFPVTLVLIKDKR